MSKIPEFSNWQEAWEWHAQQTQNEYANQSEAALLKKIQKRQYDAYYQIWYSLGQIGTLAASAPVLLEVLRREAGEDNMLIRYHCAGALFHLLGYPDDPLPELRKRVQWAYGDEAARQAAIDELEQLIQSRRAAPE
ncbi:MAG: hypothetical protein IPM53_13360 [Anaerolineaceae bacterium]|nr:hypothetical protein [Anaerolineaceae bacterium]